MKAKVCGLTAKTDLLGIIELYPDFIGFVCYDQSPRYISPDELSKLPLGEHNRGGIKSVGVFVNPTFGQIQNYVDKGVLEAVQLHGDEKPALIEEIRGKLPHLTIIKAFRIEKTFDFDQTIKYGADLFLFDAASEQFGGSGKTFEWKYLANYRGNTPFLVAGGLGPENIGEALTAFKKFPLCVGVDASSKLEISPGEKDLEKTDTFIMKVKNG